MIDQAVLVQTESVALCPESSMDGGLESLISAVDNVQSAALNSSDDESRALTIKTKKRVKRFSDSDSDVPKENKLTDSEEARSERNSDDENPVVQKSGAKSRIRRAAVSDDESSDEEVKRHTQALRSGGSSDDEDSITIFKKTTDKSRIRKIISRDEDSDSNSVIEPIPNKNEEQQLRMKNKKDKLKDKFKTLLSSRGKDTENKNNDSGDESGGDSSKDSDCSDEISSIDVIKQKIKERSASLKMTICDPDTSDEESHHKIEVSRPKKEQKRTKLTSPKPKGQRMSAKQAMENMQKIKSESNRMLREKEVSLPYHRPKALSLQDIMKRRRPAVSTDGKALPIKMNEEQLKQYALLLEQRQKEMMELCKSESEEEETTECNSTDNLNESAKEETEKKDLNNKTTAQIESEIDNIINTELGETNPEACVSEKVDPVETPGTSETPINNESVVEEIVQNKSGDVSAEMELVYNDSIEENIETNDDAKPNEKEIETNEKTDQINDESGSSINIKENTSHDINMEHKQEEKEDNVKQSEKTKHNTEVESQLISLHYDSEKTEPTEIESVMERDSEEVVGNNIDENDKFDSVESPEREEFPDDDIDMNDINMDDIDNMIENAEIIQSSGTGAMDSPALVRDIPVLNVKPKLTGAPGMVIDLDGSDPIGPKKLTGVELLKERFKYFSKLKTPEELERDREKRQKPGTQHLKLKKELENIIAEQRSLEWSKRLESEKQQQAEMDAIRGDGSDAEDDIDKIEAKLNESDVEKESSSESEEEEDLLEDDVLIEDKPKKKNPLLADEAEESDVDEEKDKNDKDIEEGDENLENDVVDGDDQNGDEDEEDSSEEEESSESEEENQGVTKLKKGRILKAFEDSDDEDIVQLEEKKESPTSESTIVNNEENSYNAGTDNLSQSQSYGIMDSQDDVIQLAQMPKQLSSDVFTSQGSALNNLQNNGAKSDNSNDEEDLGTQSFSIMKSNKTVTDVDDPDKLTIISNDSDKISVTSGDLDKLTVISETQPFNDDNFDAVVGMCSGNFQTQNCVEIQPPTTQSQMSQSQAIGEYLLNMCTGKFYDNQFVSPIDDKINSSDELSQDPTPVVNRETEENAPKVIVNKEKNVQEDILKSVLDELNEPDLEQAKPLKFFFDGKSQNKENQLNVTNTQVKKRFVIDSDEETNEAESVPKKKKFKKKKLEQRALQISDDEEEFEDEEEDEYISENEKEDGNEEERLVEYDSEENEIEVKPQPLKKKKKRKATEFFEQEAELTSEDEWVGSGDEDEAGLDRMEREAGDDDTFHQGKLQRELGQIHMRDVLDQDKREVRMIQELLFEDGDLGGGGRQRKFRWRNADGEEVTGTIPDEFADTQEEEFESEEQWRKQRHEREMFLRQMKKGEEEDDLNVTLNRTSIIKANLLSRTMSSLKEEVNQSTTEAPKTAVPEKKSAKDIPSPAKKPFAIFQQNYHGSLLNRGAGALARLAALATPLATDDAPKPLAPSAKRNFVFAALTPDDNEPKVTKRKAESNVGTPRLVKKMKTEEKQNRTKSSLLDFLKT